MASSFVSLLLPFWVVGPLEVATRLPSGSLRTKASSALLVWSHGFPSRNPRTLIANCAFSRRVRRLSIKFSTTMRPTRSLRSIWRCMLLIWHNAFPSNLESVSNMAWGFLLVFIRNFLLDLFFFSQPWRPGEWTHSGRPVRGSTRSSTSLRIGASSWRKRTSWFLSTSHGKPTATKKKKKKKKTPTKEQVSQFQKTAKQEHNQYQNNVTTWHCFFFFFFFFGFQVSRGLEVFLREWLWWLCFGLRHCMPAVEGYDRAVWSQDLARRRFEVRESEVEIWSRGDDCSVFGHDGSNINHVMLFLRCFANCPSSCFSSQDIFNDSVKYTANTPPAQIKARTWRSSMITPFAGNIMIFLYNCTQRNDSAPYRVKLVHNEREFDIGDIYQECSSLLNRLFLVFSFFFVFCFLFLGSLRCRWSHLLCPT